ncbi:MAG: nucleotidyl transferase AbiEii/AbiGii toxin family protein [Gemmatimonadaceae bacterium]
MDSPPSPHPPIDLSKFIAAIAGELTALHLPFMLIGGQAVLVHGRPRLTEDIDITLGASPEKLAVVRNISDSLGLEPLPVDVEQFVWDTFVLPVRHPQSGIRVDFIFSTTPYEQQAIARATLVEVGGTQVPFAAAEDLIIHKVFAKRPRDIEDAIGVVRRKGALLDWEYLRHWARAFREVPGQEDLPELIERLRRDQ